MNTIEAFSLDDCRSAVSSYDEADALDILRKLVAAYDLLAPPPDLWPADAQWFTIDANGEADWHQREPDVDLYWSKWISGTEEEAGNYHLELGIDWRLCKWPRPKVE